MTVTLTPHAQARVQDLAARLGQAPETIIETALDALTEREWREGFEAMGRDLDVEFMLPAGREVVFGD